MIMKRLTPLLYILMIAFSFSFSGCELMNGTEMADVAYFKPIFATVEELTMDISIDPPLDYTQSGKVITYGDYVFVNSPNKGIHIVDNTDPSNPINKLFISLAGNIDMAIVEDHLYADMFSALVVLDISNIDEPILLEDYTVEDVFYFDQYWNYPSLEELEAYEYDRVGYENTDMSQGIVLDWEIEIREEEVENYDMYYEGVAVMDSDDKSTEDGGSGQVSTAGSMTRFLPIDQFLYTISFNELVLLELTSSHQPLRWGKLDTETWAETLFRLNDILYVGSTNGMLMYDITDAGNPSYINRIEHFRSCDPVVADEAYAYVTLRGGTNCWTDLNELQIIDIQDSQNLSVVGRHILYNPHGLAVIGDHLIVCDGTAGVKVVDIADRTAPKILGTYPIDFAYDVIVSYPTALVVGEQVMYQYDISNLPELVKISEFDILGNSN
jgi:hypothetical protein